MPMRSLSQRWRAPIALVVLALLFACLKGRSPTDATANDVRFDLHAQVSGGSVLHITVVYLDQVTSSQATVPVLLLDQRVTVAAGTQSLPLTIDLTRCLADPQHITGTTCELLAGVVLEQNGQAVDSVGVGPVTVTPGQTVQATASLVPVGRVVVYPKSASLTIGAITVLHDSVFSPSNVYLPNATVTWTSADQRTAKVNASGAVTGVAAGTTTVKASTGGQSDSATITVSSTTTGAGTILINAPVGVSFSAPAGGALPVRAPLSVTSSDTVVLTGLTSSIAYGAGQPTGWLFANMSDSTSYFFGQRVSGSRVRRQTSGSGIVTPAVLDMVPTTTNLPTGTYTATVTVSGTNATSGSVSVTYSITAATPVLAFTPNPVLFNQYAYGTTVAPLQTVTAYNAGTGTLGPLSTVGKITYTGADTGWLTISAASATTATGQPKTTALHLGSDTASIPISATGATNNPVTLTAIVSSYVTYSKVVLGAAFGCGLTTASTVYCWGGDGQGELGDGGTDLGVKTPVRANIPYSPTNPVIDIEAGSFHACALLQSGAVYCWGRNDKGQLGVGLTTSPIATPTLISGHTYQMISLGSLHSCGIEGTPSNRVANYVDCWGDNTDAEFGNNTTSTSPQYTPLLAIFQAFYTLSAGNLYTCGITAASGGSLYCWGLDSFGQLGNGQSTGVYTAPNLVTLALGAGPPPVPVSVSAGYQTTCAIDAAGNGYCWGDNTNGEVGNGTTSTTPVASPTPMFGNYSWTSISMGYSSACGIASNGQYCWGYDNYGQLGNGITSNTGAGSPGQVLGGGVGILFSEFTVGQGSQSACYIKGSAVSCFGFDSNGQLGDGGVVTVGNSDAPVPMTAQPAPAGVGPARVIKRPTVRRQVRK
jgi:alpha-tubulin suppressor-like RCC1 family protein